MIVADIRNLHQNTHLLQPQICIIITAIEHFSKTQWQIYIISHKKPFFHKHCARACLNLVIHDNRRSN